MIVGGEFMTPIFRVQLNGWQCLQMLKKFKDKPKKTQEAYSQHIVETKIEYEQMILTVWFQFNGTEWDKRTDLVQRFENDELTEVVNSGEWL